MKNRKLRNMMAAAALVCAVVPVSACATEGTARSSVQAGLSGLGGAPTSSSQAPTRTSANQQSERITAVPSGNLAIDEPGTYILEGNMRGTVRVDPGEGDVTLVMSNAQIDGGGAPAIEAVSGNSLTLVLPEGTQNQVGSSGATAPGKGAIESSVDVFFEGPGALSVIGDQQPAIRTNNADMTFNGGSIDIISAGNGMATEGSRPGDLTVNGGNLAFHVGGEDMAPGTQMANNGGTMQDLGFGPAYGFDTYMNQQPTMQQGQQPTMQQGQQLTSTSNTVGEIIKSTAENTAADLVADMANAVSIVMSDDNNQVKITTAGTYVVSGSASDGNIVVKKGTEGVILILENLDLTSTTGATLSVNKEAEVQIVVSGTVTLTDNEDPADEDSTDADVADAYDGAAIKVKAGSEVYITGDGTLNVNGNAKNGIKAGDESSLIIDGEDLVININAANDGINANYDLTILSGDVNINAVDDAIHADHILSVGDEETGEGPTINVESSTEGLEATVVNIFGGDISVKSSDDAINAANKDGVYEGELGYSINMTGGNVNITSGGDGMDSNGNVNLVGGSATIKSSSGGGEAGIDYDGELYVSNEFKLNNSSGVAGPDGAPGQMGQMGQFGQQAQQGQFGQQGTQMNQQMQPGQQTGQMGQARQFGQQGGQMGARR